MMFIETASLVDKLKILKIKWMSIDNAMLSLKLIDRSRAIRSTATAEFYKNNMLQMGMVNLVWVSIIDADPTKNKAYLNWVLRLIVSKRWLEKNRSVYLEDLRQVNGYLTTYDLLKTKNKLTPEQKDINRIADDTDLWRIVSSYADTSSNRDKDKAVEAKLLEKKKAIILHDDDTYKIVRIKSKEAAIFYGRNTKWCTAAEKNNAYAYYKSGHLIVILHKKSNKRWQFYVEPPAFGNTTLMDETDKDVPYKEFADAHPLVFSKYIVFPINKIKAASKYDDTQPNFYIYPYAFEECGPTFARNYRDFIDQDAKFLTPEMLRIHISYHPGALYYIKDNDPNLEEYQMLAIKYSVEPKGSGAWSKYSNNFINNILEVLKRQHASQAVKEYYTKMTGNLYPKVAARVKDS